MKKHYVLSITTPEALHLDMDEMVQALRNAIINKNMKRLDDDKSFISRPTIKIEIGDDFSKK